MRASAGVGEHGSGDRNDLVLGECPAEHLDRLFDRFYRVDGARSHTHGGSGLGLAIVSRIMDRHGGRIEIGDSPLGGAKVATLWPKRT